VQLPLIIIISSSSSSNSSTMQQQQQQQQHHTSQGLQLGDDSAVKSSVSKYYGEVCDLVGGQHLHDQGPCCKAVSFQLLLFWIARPHCCSRCMQCS